jgi:hypothetical protein
MMRNDETQALRDELEQFRKEKEQIRALVGQIGGAQASQRDHLVNILFVTGILGLFVLDIMRHFFHFNVPLPPLFSIEVGVLMVSLKIIWMMHKQTKVEHFQFWILNSIEFRLNDISKEIRQLRNRLKSI